MERKTRKITYKMLADFLKVSEHTVYHWAKDKKEIALLGYKAAIEQKLVADPRD